MRIFQEGEKVNVFCILEILSVDSRGESEFSRLNSGNRNDPISRNNMLK